MRSLVEQAVEIQVKFVVDTERDFDEVLSIVRQLEVRPSEVWIMPQGISEQELDRSRQWLEPWARSHAFEFCDRMHIRWYGNRRGT